jgi:hypothetical protein
MNDPAIPQWDTHQKRIKRGTQTTTFTLMFTAALFTIAKRRK